MTFVGSRVIEPPVLDLVLAELISVNSTTRTPTLVGVTIDAVAADVVAEHLDAKKRSDQLGWSWTWRRVGGGVVSVWPDHFGKIWRIEFVAAPGEDDSVDLPCVKAFPVQDSRANYNSAIDSGTCIARTGRDTFRLRDSSFFEADFEGAGEGRLQRALWSRPAVVAMPPLPVRSGVITAQLESDKSVYHVGEPVMLRLTLINRTDQKVFYGVAAPYELSALEVFTAEGKVLSRSVGPGPCSDCEGRTVTAPLDPGKPVVVVYDRTGTGAFREVAAVKDWGYVLRYPGTYTIIAHLNVAAIGVSGPEFITSPTDKSNAVQITIVK